MKSVATIIFSILHFGLFAQKLPNKTQLIARAMQVYQSSSKATLNHKTDSLLWQNASYIAALTQLQTQTNSPALAKYLNNWQNQNSPKAISLEQAESPQYQCLIHTGLLLTQGKPSSQKWQAALALIDSLKRSYKVDIVKQANHLYLTMPLWATLAKSKNDSSYLEKLYQIYMYTKNVEGLYAAQDLLWWPNAGQKEPKKNLSGRNILPAISNAMIVSALASTMEQLPANSPYFNEYGDTFAEMTIAMMNLQDSNGLWPSSLSDFNSKQSNYDTTATALIVQAMAWGVHRGRLDRDTFVPLITKAYYALNKAYSPANSPKMSPIANAAFIQACLQIAKL
jgi:unsaturated rhamnogalacturonyl hydrolase